MTKVKPGKVDRKEGVIVAEYEELVVVSVDAPDVGKEH